MRRIEFSGSLTVARAVEVREALLQAMAPGEDVEVVIGDIAAVDLTFLQILCAAHRAAVERGRQVCLAKDLPALLQQTIDISGFARHESCPRGGSAPCLWQNRTRAPESP